MRYSILGGILLLLLGFLPTVVEANPPQQLKDNNVKIQDVKLPPPVFEKNQLHPDSDCEAVLGFLAKIAAEDRPFYRFFSFSSVPKNYVENLSIVFKFYLNTVSTSRTLIPLYEVRAASLIYALDIRIPRWNVEAFSAVAHRDVIYTEPNIDSHLAEGLRRQLGIAQDPKTFHVEAIIPAPFFIRQVMETDISTTYYDLLYANERYGVGAGTPGIIGTQVVNTNPEVGPEPIKPLPRPWKGGVWPADGQLYQKGSFEYTPIEELQAWEKLHKEWESKKGELKQEATLPIGSVLKGKVNKDFPATVNDWNKKWGIKAVEDFLNQEKLFVANGEVVAGAKSDGARGSYVSYHDRIITFLPVPTGVAMRSYDSLKTAMKKNYANFPKEVTVGDVPFDAGELLVNLPNGLQAAMLINGKGDRVEVGDSRVVRNSIDTFDVTVKTQVACITCHGSNLGVIAPSNQKVKEAIARGNRLLAKDPDTQEQLDAFFEEFTDKIETWRDPYRKILKKITVTKADNKGWTGQKLGTESLIARNWYDGPVTLNQAAAELGLPRLAVVLACGVEGSIDAGNLLLDDGAVPREVWDADLYPRLALILSAFRNYEAQNPIFKFFFPELLRQSAITKPK